MPFTSAFALNPWLPLPMSFMMVISIYILFSYQLRVLKEDWEIFLVIILGILGFLCSKSYFGSKNINHTAAILSTVLFFYILPKILLLKCKYIELLGKTVAISLALVSFFIAIEFIGSNFLGINFLNIIPYSRTDLGDALVKGIWIRPRGFAEEAGHMAVFYEMALPLSYLYLNNKPFIIKGCYYIPVFITFIILFSAAAFVALLLAIIIVTVLKIRSQRSLIILAIISLITVVIFSSDITRHYVDATVGSRLEIFSDASEQNNFSAIDRRNRYENALEIFQSAPFGIGWGMSSQLAEDSQTFAGIVFKEAGLISLYAEILVASGILGLLLFLKFITKKIITLIMLKSFESRLILVSVLSISLHYIFISNYWFPMLWFSLALADKVVRIANKPKTVKFIQ
jgi:hypothetical protein